jgi:hypothetical protein
MCTKNLANTRPGTCSFGLTKKWGFIILSSRCIKLQSSSRLLSCICAPKNKYVPIGSEAALCALQQQSLNTSVLWHVSSHFIYPISLCSNSADRIPCRNDFALAFVICFLRSMPCGFGSTRKWRSAVNRQQLIPMNKQLLATNVTWEHAQTHVFLTPSGAIDFLVKWRNVSQKRMPSR